MFWMRNKENSFPIHTLIWSPVVVCKIVISISFDVSFLCSKEPSHREDSFVHQKCLSKNIIDDLCIISKLIKDVLEFF